MKKEAARKKTIEIFRIILEEQNGYSKEEIVENNLAEECEGTEIWERIYDVIIGK